MNRRQRFGIILTTLMLLNPASPLELMAQNMSGTSLPEVQVSVARAALTPVVNQIEVIGTVVAKHRAEIASKVSGTIGSLPVLLGSNVAAGELLVGINAGEIDAKVRQAEAQLNQARRNLDREQKLLAKNAATPESVKSLAESLAIAEAAFEEARTMQSYTRITAPFSGTVTRTFANQGDLATPGKPPLDIEDLSRLQILTDIPEEKSLTIGLGDVLPVQLPSAALTIYGTVVEIAPTANPITRSAAIKLDIDNAPLIRPGQFARVVLAGLDRDTITVPRASVVRRGQMEIVFVVSDNTARLRLVKTGSRHGDQIEILAGLGAGEQVVTSGQNRLRDGQPVVIE